MLVIVINNVKNEKNIFSYPEKVLLHTKLFTHKNKSNWLNHILSQVGKFCKLIIKIEKKISSFIALLHSKPCNLDGSQLIEGFVL